MFQLSWWCGRNPKSLVIDVDINVTWQILIWRVRFPLFQKEFLATFWNVCFAGPLRSSVLKRGVHNKSQRLASKEERHGLLYKLPKNHKRTNRRNQNISSQINSHFHYFSKEL